MNESIKMSKIIFGSLSSSIGDGTIGYSPNVSDRAREVGGRYVDIPPRLNTSYSSVIWQYHLSTDKYLITHVQAQHVLDEAMGRVFAYRAAFEVGREEMNRFGFPLGGVMNSFPRIRNFDKAERWDDEVSLLPYARKGNDSITRGLKQLVEVAIASGRRIYLSMPASESLRGNGIFASEEWNTVIDAVQMLDIETRRYASFAFCVDENYAQYLDDVLIVVYVRGSGMQVPEGCFNYEFERIPVLPLKDEQLQDFHIAMKVVPGGDGPLLRLPELMQKVKSVSARLSDVRKMNPCAFTYEDYRIWLTLGHRPDELRAGNWTELDHILGYLSGDDAARSIVIANHKACVRTWDISGLSEERVSMFGLKDLLDGGWLRKNMSEIKKDPERWHGMFENLSLLKKSGVKEAFMEAYGPKAEKDFGNIRDARGLLEQVEKYRGILSDEHLVSIICALNPVKDCNLIENLIGEKGNFSRGTGIVLMVALKQIASDKASELGADMEKWMKFLKGLKDEHDEPCKLSWKLYLLQVKQWDGQSVKALSDSIVEYSTKHTRIIESEPFTFVVKTLRSIIDSDKIQKKQSGKSSPRQLQENMQEEKGKMAAGLNEEGDQTFEELYQEVIKVEKRHSKRNKAIIALASFAIGIVLTCGVSFVINGLSGATPEGPGIEGGDGPAVSNMVSVTRSDSVQNLMLQLANVPLDSSLVTVQFGDSVNEAVNLGDFDQLVRLDDLYNEWRGISSDSLKLNVYDVDSVGEILIRSQHDVSIPAGCALLDQIYNKAYLVNSVKFPDNSSVIIPNGDLSADDWKGDKRTNSVKYYFWLIRQIDAIMKEKGIKATIAY